MNSREVLICAAAFYAATLFIAARGGVTGTLEGSIKRADCLPGYRIVLIAHGAAIVALAALVLIAV